MDPLLPVYERGVTKGVATKKVVEILLEPNQEAVARAVPTSISSNAIFIVDISAPHIKHFKNLLADDLGAWNPTRTKHQFYRAPTKTRPVMKVSQEIFQDANERYIYQSTRSFYRNKSSADLQRIVIYLTG